MTPSLTTAQAQSLKANIDANATSITVTYDTGFQVTDQIKNLPNDGTTANAIAKWYNGLPGTDFFAYYATVPLAAIKGAIQWKKLTPADAVPTTPQLAVAVWQARCQLCQIDEQEVRDLMSMGNNGTIDATPNRIVQGFQDALGTVPSDAGGAAQDAGWAIPNGVRSVLCRKLTNAEKVLADTTNGTGADNSHAAACTAEGALSGQEVLTARGG